MSPATEIASPADAGSRYPRLTQAPEGTVWMSWLQEERDDTHSLRAAALRAGEWTSPLTVARNSGWFVNWADFPSLLVGPGQFLAVHWLAKTPGGTYAYDVMLSVSTDSGESWSPPFSPHDDGTATEHGFVSLFPAGEGFGAVWLDGRNMASSSGGHDSTHGHGDGGMTLRSAIIGFDGTIREGTEIDSLTCDCCQTGAALTSAGPLIVYRNRDGDEVRDIYFSVYRDGRWARERPVAEDGWQIAACPVNGPAVDALGNVAVTAWFTAAPSPRIRAAFFSDTSGEFSTPLDVDEDRPLGRVDAVLLEDGSAVVSWLAAGEEQLGTIRYRRIWPDGRLGQTAVLAEIPTARSAGFPQVAAGGAGLVFAWTMPGEPSRILTATAPVPADRHSD